MKDFKFLKTQKKIEPNLNGRLYPKNLYVNVDHIKNFILNIYLFGTVITLSVKYLVNAGF